MTLRNPSAPDASESAEYWSDAKTRNSRATMRPADAIARRCIRRRATVGWAVPASQSRRADTIESTDQWIMKTTMKAIRKPGRGSPGWGIRGSANVQRMRIAVSEKSAFAKFLPGRLNAVVKRKSRYGKSTSSATSTRPTARSGRFPG